MRKPAGTSLHCGVRYLDPSHVHERACYSTAPPRRSLRPTAVTIVEATASMSELTADAWDRARRGEVK